MTNVHALQNKKAPNKQPKTKKGIQKLEKKIRHNVGQKRPPPNEQKKAVDEQLWYRELQQPTLFDIFNALSEQQPPESSSIPNVEGWGRWLMLAMILNFFTGTYARTWDKAYQRPKVPPLDPGAGPASGPGPAPGSNSRGSGSSTYNHGRPTDIYELLTTFQNDETGPGASPITGLNTVQQQQRQRRDAGTDGQFGNATSLPENVIVYPSQTLSPYMRKAISSVQSFEQVAAFALKRAGYNPHENLPVAIIHITGGIDVSGSVPAGTRQETTRTPIEILQHFCTTDRGGLDILGESPTARKLIGEIRTMEKKGENFFEKKGVEQIKWRTIHDGIDVFMEKLADFGINRSDKAKFYHVEMRGRRTEFGAAESNHHRAELGSIIETQKDGETQRYAIVPHHPNLVFKVPTDPAGFRSWMTLVGTRLLYRDPSALPANPRFVTTLVEQAGSHRLDTVRTAVKHTLHPIIGNTVKKMADLVTRESTFTEAFNTILGCYIPFWDAGRAIYQGDYKSAAIFVGFEIVPYLNKFKKWVFKTNYVGKTIPAEQAAQGNEWVSVGFDGIKTANGLGFFKMIPKQAIKPAGRTIIKNNQNSNNRESDQQ
ncbi:MAG TPA: hypothetical protein VHC91_06545 [Trinickia sp.]|uniref:hypothetical protein n=1 Tax=Trinickia sp. TaxID=2571163 RepID=UPI002B89CB82|nr:hypothetical protein [Trinickia sp.]HVW50050.1 hypothetical protein [Trinickia sp.]